MSQNSGDQNKQQIEELFDFSPPLAIDRQIDVGGVIVHTNGRIRRNMRDLVSSSKHYTTVKDKLIEGIDNEIIISAYLKPGFFRHLKDRIKGTFIRPTSLSLSNAVFDPIDRKIVLILDQNVDFFGNLLKYYVPIIVHECVHLAASELRGDFLGRTLRTYLLPFYKTVISRIIKPELIQDDILIGTIKELFQKVELNQSPIIPASYSARVIWANFFLDHGIDNVKAGRFAKYLLVPIIIEQERVTLTPTLRNLLIDVRKGYFEAYKALGYDFHWSVTYPGQEAMFPSEIVCMTTYHGLTPTASNLINSIDMSMR